jgi:hypothetical protein
MARIMMYTNDNDDFPFITRPEPSEEDSWLEEKRQIEEIAYKLNTKLKKMASDMVCYIYNNLSSHSGFELVPLYWDIPECRVTIRGVGKKKSLMYLIRIEPVLYNISISPVHTLEEKDYYNTPKEIVEVLLHTQRVYVAV